MYPVSNWIRFINFIVDFIFIKYALMRLLVVPLIRQIYPSLYTYDSDNFRLIFYVISLVVFFTYYFVAEATTGMTVGKIFTQTKVVTIDGNRPTVRNVLFRTLWRIVPLEVLSWLGYTGWHDRQTGTMVVRIGEEYREDEQPTDITE